MKKIKTITFILIGFCQSILQIGKYIIVGKKVEVLFYYPMHFNRDKDGLNPYFTSLIDFCNKNKIRYLLLEEPVINSKFPRNPNAIKADFIFFIVLILRKILSFWVEDFWIKETIIARFLNVITFHRLEVNNYITISGNMQEIFQRLNKKAKVFDVQHGLICSTHKGYFESDGTIRPLLSNPQLNFFVFGEGFKAVFNNSKKNLDVLNRVHVVGLNEPRKISKIKINEPIVVLFSLQYTVDSTIQDITNMNELLSKSLEKLKNYKVLFKHHPRFKNRNDVNELINQYKNIEITEESVDLLAAKIDLHITFFSTTTFEFARFGIPTYLLYNNKFDIGKEIFYDDFIYPLFENKDLEEVLKIFNKYDDCEKHSIQILNWYNKFYSLPNEINFLNAIKY